MRRARRQMITLLVLSIIGLGLSIFSYLQHFGVASSSFCTINATFDCDVVNRGPYGTFMGLPVSLIGMVGYALLVAGFGVKLHKSEDRELTRFLLMASIAGLAFAFYLTGIEAFILHAYCLICLASQAVILAIVGFLLSYWKSEQHTTT